MYHFCVQNIAVYIILNLIEQYIFIVLANIPNNNFTSVLEPQLQGFRILKGPSSNGIPSTHTHTHAITVVSKPAISNNFKLANKRDNMNLFNISQPIYISIRSANLQGNLKTADGCLTVKVANFFEWVMMAWTFFSTNNIIIASMTSECVVLVINYELINWIVLLLMGLVFALIVSVDWCFCLLLM